MGKYYTYWNVRKIKRNNKGIMDGEGKIKRDPEIKSGTREDRGKEGKMIGEIVEYIILKHNYLVNL